MRSCSFARVPGVLRVDNRLTLRERSTRQLRKSRTPLR